MEKKLFTKEEALFFGELEEKARLNDLKERVQSLVSYLKENYGSKIKDAIKKNPSIREITFDIPKQYMVKGRKWEIDDILNKEFGLLGFEVSYSLEHCNCLFNPLCNRNSGKVTFKW